MMTSEKLKQNPFYEAPLHKAYYHPTHLTNVARKDGKDALVANAALDDVATTSADKDFLLSSHTFLPGAALPSSLLSPQDNSAKFEESWPSSEKPSSLSIPGISPSAASQYDDSLSGLMARLGQLDGISSRLSFEKGAESDGDAGVQGAESTLAKYIKRFREGLPMSRKEREKAADKTKRDFWWLHGGYEPQPSDSSTPRSDVKVTSKSRTSRSPPSYFSHPGEISTHSRSSHHRRSPSPIDEHTSKLQQRAESLLERTASSLNSTEPAVSTDGLGSTGTTSMSTLEERPYRPRFTKWRETEEGHRFAAPLKPENDILHQWRLRRRMEILREKVVTPAAFSVPKHTEVDGKLSEFRERLAQATLTGETELECSTTFHGVVPPESVASGPAEADPPLHRIKENVAETAQTAAAIETVAKQPSRATSSPQASHPTGGRHVHRTPIASPSLPQASSNLEGDSVAPHLHLACDVLPCPHGTDHGPALYFESQREHSKHHCSCCHDKHRPCCQTNRDAHHHPDECTSKVSNKPRGRGWSRRTAELRKSASSDTDSDFEQCKKKHLMSMQREIEESLASTESESTRHRSHQVKGRSKKSSRSKSRDKYELYSSVEVPERDSNPGKRSNSEPVRSSTEQRERSSDSSRRDKSKEKSTGKSSSLDRKSHQKQNVKEDSAETTSQLDRGGGVSRKNEPSNKMRPPLKEKVPQQFPEPTFQSSPKSFKLSSTIGQVIKENLFVASSGEMGEIGDSQNYDAEPDDSEPESLTEQPKDGVPENFVDTAMAALQISDGEDYEDDDILRDLRKRRGKHLSRIEEINMLLGKLDE